MKTTRFFGFINGIGFSPVGKRDADAFVRKGSRYGSPITFTGYRSFYIIDEAISNPSNSSIVKTNERNVDRDACNFIVFIERSRHKCSSNRRL